MGAVWLGRLTVLARDVAVKFLFHAASGADDPHFERFLLEARTAASVRHPNLVQIYDTNLLGKLPYLVLEYIDGPTMAQVLQRRGALDMAQVLAVLEPVADAVAQLHERGIVHRDLMPSNVLLDRDGRVVVSDFGLACAGARAEGGTAVAGTPGYMAPEMFEGTASARTDVYALGVMAYQLLTGALPFTGSMAELSRRHREDPLSLDPLEARGVDGAVIQVVCQATRKNPVFRYKTAAHLLRALKAAVPDARIGSRGAVELAHEALRVDADSASASVGETKTPSTLTYHDHLHDVASAKRFRKTSGAAIDATPEEREPPARDQVVSTSTPLARRRSRRDFLTLKSCPQCDYSLDGLPANHRCPECGFEYDESMFAVSGFAIGGYGGLSTTDHRFSVAGRLIFGTRRERIWGYLGLALLGFFAAGSLYRLCTHGQVSVMGLFWPSVFVVTIVRIRQWRHRRDEGRGTVQLLFTAAGASRCGAGPLVLIPWSQFRRFRFRRSPTDLLTRQRNLWVLRLRGGWLRSSVGSRDVSGLIECTTREAATLRGDIRRRLRVAGRLNRPTAKAV